MKTSTCFGITLFLLFFSLGLKAAPIAGGHISYRAIDSVTYVVTAQIFAECDTVNPNVGDSLIVSWNGGSYTTAMTLLSITDVTGLPNHCPTGSGCWQGSVLKIYAHQFTDTVDISQANGCTITFAYAKGKRSTFITTGSAETDFYIYSTLNRCNGLNNSAHITLPPQFYIAVGQDAVLNAGYLDTIDGDSLGFEIISAKTSAVNNVSYLPPWNHLKPLTFLGFPNAGLNHPAGFNFDTSTCQLYFRPTMQNQGTVLTFEAIEYTKINGVTVEKGRTKLEHKVTVLPVNNNKAPKISGANLIICEGQQVCRIYSTDDADGDSTHITWDHVIPGATLSVDSGKFQKATFCWTPTLADVRSTPYVFMLEANDRTCTFNRSTKRIVTVYVRPRLDTTLLETEKEVSCNKITVIMKKAVPQGTTRLVAFQAEGKYIQSIGDTSVFAARDTGWVKILLYISNNSCFKQIIDSVYINPQYSINLAPLRDTAVCPNTAVNLTTTPLNGSGPYLYYWDPFNFRTQTVSINIATIPRTLFITVVDSVGCTGYDTVLVRVHSLQKVRFDKPDTLCTNHNQQVLPVIPPGGKYYGNGIINNSFFNPDSAGIGFHTLLYAVSDSNGCNVTGTKTIRVLNAPQIPQFTASTAAGGVPLSVNFVNQSIGPISKHIWIFTREDGLITDTITSTSYTITKVFNDTGTYHVTLINYSGICDASVTKNKYITVRSTVGIKPVQNSHFRIYPNPAKDAVMVEGENILLVELTDITGKIIPAVIEKNGNEHLILSPGTSGIYLLQITANDGVKVSAKVIFME